MVEVSMEDEYMIEEIVQEAIAASPADGNSTGRFTIESVSLPPGIIQVQTEGTARKRRQLAQRQRELSSYVGTKPVLVVRVTDVNGLSPTGDAHTMSDKFFGTYGDPETMVTQFDSCSYGAFKIVTKQYPQMSAPGVLDVSIPVSLTNSGKDVIRKAIHNAVEPSLDLVPLRVHLHMFCMSLKNAMSIVDGQRMPMSIHGYQSIIPSTSCIPPWHFTRWVII